MKAYVYQDSQLGSGSKSTENFFFLLIQLLSDKAFQSAALA